MTWVGALFLAWQAGPWSENADGTSGDDSPHDETFHMHRPLHAGGKVSMVDQIHLELASTPDGEHRLWISNARRKELDPAGFEGSLEVVSPTGGTERVTFEREGRGKSLLARTAPLEDQVWLTVDGRLGDLVTFEGVKFFWDHQPQAQLDSPLGLDPMVPMAPDNRLTLEKIDLGRELFFDPELSDDGSIACASCHKPGQAFADTSAVSTGVGGRKGRRNTPSLLNVAYYPELTWDGRSTSLEEQCHEPIFSPLEMGVADEDALGRRLEPVYGDRLREIFGDASTRSVTMALASFERTLFSGDSDFDRYEAGDRAAIGPAARRGRDLFFGTARCGSCHIPPLFTDLEFHNLGVGWQGAENGDRGRFEITGEASDLGAFKTPSLRDVSLTEPYMHDGSIASLEEVVAFYNRGGSANPALDPLMRPLDLTERQVQDLVAFLETLEGRSYATD